VKEEELKKIDITKWEEKTHLSHLPMHHGSALFNVNRYLNEIEDILREAGMEGLGYQDQEKEIEELIEDQANLNAYIYSAGWEFQEKIDTPLYKGFQNDAAEKLSRINLEDYTTENTLEIKKHHVMYDSYGNRLEYDTIAPSLSMADFLGISSLGTGSADGKLVGIPEEFKDFTSMFTMEYDSIKENLKDKDGNPISLEEYLNELHTYGEFDNKMDKPFLEFVSCILDVTMLKPLIEMCWGYDLITGEDLSDFERGMKGVFAVIDVVSLMIGIKASGVVRIFSKNTLKMAGKSVLLDAFGGAGAYGIGQIGQELELPLPITLLMSMGAGIGIVKVGGRYLFKDQAGNVLLDVAVQDVDALRKGVSGAKSLDDIRYEEYWKQCELLNKTTCSSETLYEYLYKINPEQAINYAKTGVWPDDIQVPKSSNVLGRDWGIDWSQVPNGGYTLDGAGNAIKSPYTPKIGEVVDRYGPGNGRYTSPVVDDIPYSYDERSLPYVENPEIYHQYEVIGDFNNIEWYVKNCNDSAIKTRAEDYINTYYGGDYSKVIVQSGNIAPGFGTISGGVQYELPMPVDMLESLGLMRKIH
jgi:hypothetical protein